MRLCDFESLGFSALFRRSAKVGIQLSLALGLSGYALGEATDFDEERLKAEITQIVTTRSGELLRWRWQPNVAFVSADPADFDSFQRVLEEVFAEVRVDREPVFGSVEFTRLSDFLVGADTTSSLTASMELFVGRQDDEIRNFMVYRSFDGVQYKTTPVDIGVYVAPIEDLILIQEKFRISTAFTSSMSDGTTPCIFASAGNDGELHIAQVFIVSGLERHLTEECMYEQIMHSIGLQRNYDDSKYFTFDNQTKRRGPRVRRNDLNLVRSIYQTPPEVDSTVQEIIERFLRISQSQE